MSVGSRIAAPPPETSNVTQPDEGLGHQPLETFVGREREMQILRTKIDDASNGRGSLVLVSGEPGIGKTRLLTEASRYAESCGLEVLWGCGWDGDGAPTFWPFQSLLEKISNSHPGGRVAPDIHHLLPGSDPAAPPSRVERFRVFSTAVSLMTKVLGDESRLILLDDLHWFDSSSLQLLDLLVRAPTLENVSIVVTYRELEVHPHSQLERVLARASRNSAAERISLRGISAKSIAELIPAKFESQDNLVRSLMDRTEGNPLLVTELLRHYQDCPEQLEENARDRTIPHTIRGLIDLRLSRYSDETRQLLQAASIIGHTFSLDLLTEVDGNRPLPRNRLILNEVTRSSLIVNEPTGQPEYRFRHGLTKDVLYFQTPPQHRSQLHLRLAQALEKRIPGSRGSVLPQIADHYFAAGATEATDKALKYNRAAARQANERLAFEKAIPFFRNILVLIGESPSQSQLRCGALLELGETQLNSGLWSDARSTFQSAAEIARHRSLAEEFTRAAIGFRGTQGASFPPDNEAIELLEEALRRFSGALPPATRSLLLSHLTITIYSKSEEDRVRIGRSALSEARQSRDLGAIAFALLAQAHSLSAPHTFDQILGITEQLAPVANELQLPEITFRMHLLRHMCLLFNADPRADHELAMCNRLAEDLRHPTFLWQASSLKVGRAMAEGNLDQALELALKTREVGQQVHDLSAEQYYAGHEFWLAAQTGRSEKARPALYRMVEKAPNVDILRAGLVFIDSQSGRREQAVAGLEAMLMRTSSADVFQIFNLSLLSEVAFAESHRDAAAEILRRLRHFEDKMVVLSWGTLFAGAVSYYIALLQLTLETPEDAVDSLRAAIVAEKRFGATALVARSRLALSRALQALGGNDGGREAKREEYAATEAFKSLGITPPHFLRTPRKQLKSSAPNSTRAHSPVNQFESVGDYWRITFDSRTVNMKTTKGIILICQLIESQGNELTAISLAQGPAPYSDRPHVKTPDLSESTWDTMTLAIDPATRRNYAARLNGLNDQLAVARENNDLGQIGAIEAELEWVSSELQRAMRDKASPGLAHLERARVSVRNNITSALKKIHKHHPALGRHLDASIKTGRVCVYSPERPVEWSIQRV